MLAQRTTCLKKGYTLVQDSEKKARFKSLDVVLNCAQDKLRLQSSQWDGIDQKNSILLAVYGVVLVILLTGVKDISCIYIRVLYVIWWLSIVAGMACSLWSLWPRNFSAPPKIDSFIKKYLHKEIHRTKVQLLSNIRKSINQNEDVIRKKMNLMYVSIVCLSVALTISTITILLNILKGGIEK